VQLSEYKNIVIVGIGKTGVSCAKFLLENNIDFIINDSRENPPGLRELSEVLDAHKMIIGGFNRQILLTADLIILSQGVPLQNPIIAEVYKKGIKFINDVDLFCAYAKAPIVAITGSNAKSTVTTLVGNILCDAGFNVAVGGNIGVPLMTLLLSPMPDYYVLELSNFQLELTHDLKANIACILNLSPDHLDRYRNYSDYVAAKHRIYRGAKHVIYNYDDALTTPKVNATSQYFSLTELSGEHFCLRNVEEEIFICKGEQKVLDVKQLKIKGKHNWQNALAAATISDALGVPLEKIANSLKIFGGLIHRCQWLATIDGADWFNDSKGTNIGATIAAINGLGPVCQRHLILIAGGQGKGADFSELATPIQSYVQNLIVFGEDAKQLTEVLSSYVKVTKVEDLKQAVEAAKRISEKGDIILFSPACASFDMFESFEQRGEVYMQCIKELTKNGNSSSTNS